MMNSQNISFSNKLSQQRMAQAQKILGSRVANHIICFALYLLGVDRNSISGLLKTPPGSIRSIIRAVFHGGLPAFEDRRRSRSIFLPPQERKRPKVTVSVQEEWIIINLGDSDQIKIPRQNRLQTEVILLTMFNNGLLNSREVAETLDISTAHVLNLARGLHTEDISFLIDKREGQQQEYRFTPEVKAEVIQQFVLDVVVEGHTSGRLLSEHLQGRCKLSLSERSIRHHVKELGLTRIKKSLPPLLAEVKKNFKS